MKLKIFFFAISAIIVLSVTPSNALATVGGPTEVGQTGSVTNDGYFQNFDTGREHLIQSSYDQARDMGNVIAAATGHNVVTVFALQNARTGAIQGYIVVTRYVPPIATSGSRDDDTCDSAPGVGFRDDSIRFIRITDGMPVDRTALLTNVPYRVTAGVQNSNCWPTNGISRYHYNDSAWYTGTEFVRINNPAQSYGQPPANRGNTPYRNQLPFGENGTFPVEIQIDEGDNGSVDTRMSINQVGPLDGQSGSKTHMIATDSNLDTPRQYPYEHFYVHPNTLDVPTGYTTLNINSLDPTEGTFTHSMWRSLPFADSRWRMGPGITVISPVVEFDTATTGRVRAYTDVGCGGSFGCIVGSSDGQGLDFRVLGAPQITLGSYIIGNNTITDVSTRERRDVTAGQQIGLYWSGSNVDVSTCTGRVRLENGSTDNDFTAVGDTTGLTANQLLLIPANTSRIDSTITEPTTQYRTYTITCGVAGGGDTVSDSIILSNGPLSATVQLDPLLANMSVAYPDTITSIPFRVHNAGTIGVNNFTYTFTIDGQTYPSGAFAGSLPIATNSDVLYGVVNYQVPLRDDDTYTIPMRVCVQRPQMTTEQCDNATITVTVGSTIASECSDGIDNLDEEDTLADADDPGCWTNPTDPMTYYPQDTSETNNRVDTAVPDLLASVRPIDDCTTNTTTCSMTYRARISNLGTATPVGEPIPYVFERRLRPTGAWQTIQTGTIINTINQGNYRDVTFTETLTLGNYEVRARVNQPTPNSNLRETIFTNNTSGPVAFTVMRDAIPQCSDGVNNDAPEDTYIDAADPGCWASSTDSTTYDPNDTTESLVVAPTITISARPQIVRYNDTASITYTIRGVNPVSCQLTGPGIPTASISYPTVASGITNTITGTHISAPLTSTQTFTITCGATRAQTTVEVIPLAQEI